MFLRMSNAPEQFDYDVAIIGGGSGGYAAARTVANAGLRTGKPLPMIHP